MIYSSNIRTQAMQASLRLLVLLSTLYVVAIATNGISLAYQVSKTLPAEVTSPSLSQYASSIFNPDGKSENVAADFRRCLRTEKATDVEIKSFKRPLVRAIGKKENWAPSFHILRYLLELESVPEDSKLDLLDSLTYLYERTHLNDKSLQIRVESLFSTLQAVGNDRFNSKIKSTIEKAKAREDGVRKISLADVRVFEFDNEHVKLPHPVGQSVASRSKTLKEQIKAALVLVKAGKDVEFVKRFVSPVKFSMGGRSPEDYARSYLINLNGRGLIQYLVAELEEQFEKDLIWDLAGRAAWVPNNPQSIWIYQEGHWLMLPFSGHGGLPPLPPAKKVDFFDESESYPSSDLASVFATKETRLESLRAAQRQLLKISKDASRKGEMFQYWFCPISWAVNAASSGTTVGKLYALVQTPRPGREGRLRSFVESEMKRQINTKPVWTSSGRVASFPTRKKVLAQLTWRFYEGRWRLELPK